MSDLIMLAAITAFFVVCVAYVALCQRIIGEDPPTMDAPLSAETDVAEVRS